MVFDVVTGTNQSLSCTGGDVKSLNAGEATCVITGSQLSAAASPLFVLAGYEGSNSYQPSQASTSQPINVASTALKLKSSANPSKKDQTVTFTATVKVKSPGSGSPTGSVVFSFSPAKKLKCTGGDDVKLTSKDTATCSVKFSVSDTVTATYLGSSSYASSDASVEQTVS